MKYTLEQKAQLMVLQNPKYTFVGELEKYLFITEGHYGIYVDKQKAIIDIAKTKIHDFSKFEPELIMSKTAPAHVTKYLMQFGSVQVIKLSDDEGRETWVKTEFLKIFDNNGAVYRISKESPLTEQIYVTDHKENPLGIILPIKVNTD